MPVHLVAPQGSIWGLPFLLLYVNDLSSSISNDHLKCYVYADDMAVLISCRYSSLANHLLFTINAIIEDWTAANLSV